MLSSAYGIPFSNTTINHGNITINKSGEISLSENELNASRINSINNSNDSILEDLDKATDESYKSFKIPMTNSNIEGPKENTQTNSSTTAHSSLSEQDTNLTPSLQISGSGGLSIGSNQGPFGNVSNITPSHNFNTEKHKINGLPKYRTSLVGETSVASNDNLVFLTGNWYAASSNDGGNTWSYWNISKDFNDVCCDQKVIFDKKHKLFLWYRQGDSDPNTNENIVRVSVSRNLDNWSNYDINSSSINPSLKGYWFDYPEMALTDKYLYITTNAYGINQSSVVMRFSLDDINNNNFILNDYLIVPNVHTITPVQGANNTMYFGTHLTNEILRIYKWADTDPSTSIKVYDKKIPPWYVLNKGVGKCGIVTETITFSQISGNWCQRADSRITGGWMSGNTIGFFWNADAGSKTQHGATFTWPYINAATFNIDNNMSYVGRPYIWNPNFPWLYAYPSPQPDGKVGVIAYYGTNITIPGVAFGVRNSPNESIAWNMTSIANSDSSVNTEPSCGDIGHINPQICKFPDLVNDIYKWGDYITIRAHNNTSWDASAYILEGGGTRNNVAPYYIVISSNKDTTTPNQ